MKKFYLLLSVILITMTSYAKKPLSLLSPDGKIQVTVLADGKIAFNVAYDNQEIFSIPDISLTTTTGEVIGSNPKISGVKFNKIQSKVKSPFYRATELNDNYNSLNFKVNRDWSIAVRVYNDAFAYRWIYNGSKPLEIKDENTQFAFESNDKATAPYVNPRKNSPQFFNSFENTYTVTPTGQLNQERFIFLPMSVETSPGIKVAITESALENYPGMYVKGTGTGTLETVFAPYPKKEVQGGHNNLQMLVTETEDFIAKVDGPRSFPWRITVIAPDDATLASSNISYLLGEPSRLEDISWIKPGKVAWEWWNDWNLGGVDFETGVNNDTYKAYIDFASKNGIEYVILDEGWAVNKKADLMQVVPEINIKELVDYGKQKGVGIILWAGYEAFDRDMEEVCEYYSNLGVKGFKVDFMDRDDQKITDFNYRAAATAAKHGLLLDLHGTSKPAGLNRTYPNVLNFEAVNGLEQLKWSSSSLDMPLYDTQIPFLRQLAGPMDYTQGAMKNAVKKNYHASNSEPMSQGTRAHQLALYMVLDSPLNMLCDSPTNYEAEQESTDFIAGVPTVWDETLILDGKMGEYIVTARRKGDTWWIGGITNWDPRDIEIDLSMLGEGDYNASIFADGKNAHRRASDYKLTNQKVNKDSSLNVHLAPGGGVAMKIEK